MTTFMYQQQPPHLQAASGPQGEAQQQAALSLLGMRSSQSNASYSQPAAHIPQMGVYGYQQFGAAFSSKPDPNDYSGSGSAANTAQCRPVMRAAYPYHSQYQAMYPPFPATPIELLRQQVSMDHLHHQQVLNTGVYGGFHGSMPAPVPHLQTAPVDMSSAAVDSKPHASASTSTSGNSVDDSTTSPDDPTQYPFNLPLAYCHNYNRNGRVGIYAPTERKMLLQRFMEKRKKRNWSKVVSYACRKNLAQRRVRVKGRFIKRAADDAHLLVNKKKEKETTNEMPPKKMSKPVSPIEQDTGLAGPRLVSAH